MSKGIKGFQRGHIQYSNFVNINGEKICIEIFGDYWHNLPKEKINDENKLKILQKYGWERIIIWEHELKSK